MTYEEAVEVVAKERGCAPGALPVCSEFRLSICGGDPCVKVRELMELPSTVSALARGFVAFKQPADPYKEIALKIFPEGNSIPIERYVDANVSENILEEANRLVNGDRGAAYGHPLDDYTRTAGMVSAMLAHILTRAITAEEMILVMCQVKLSRQIHTPKRDNMTDLAGYALCEQKAIDERARRTNS